MNISVEIISTTVILSGLIGVNTYFVRRWMERVEAKIDGMNNLVPRSECNTSINRVHQRIDEVVTAQFDLSDRVARLEAKMG